MADLSIIVLSYNTRELLLKCLESIEGMEKGAWVTELIVVDNGSTDGTVEELEKRNNKIKILKNKENLGFAAGNNLGIREASGKFLLLINSDTVVEKDTISRMLNFLNDKPEVAVATCRVELSNGSLDPACHRGFPTPWAALTYFLGLEKIFPRSRIFSQYHLGFLPIDQPHEIDSPTGAFYLVKREVIEKIGLLDEDYFMYGEDLDWSYRIKQAGWKIMYNPKVKIFHYKRSSGRGSEDKKLKRETTGYFYDTMKIFYQKHYLTVYPAWLTKLIFLTIGLLKFIKVGRQ